MTSNMKMPDRLYIDESEREIYERLRDHPLLKRRSNKELFLLAMSLGFLYDMRKPLKKPWGFVRTEYLNEEEKSLILSIGIYAEGLDALLNKKKIFSTAEEYASAGVRYLEDLAWKEPASLDKILENLLNDVFRKIKRG